ncbi:MAG: hypothetical protein HY754_09970 [Nitrospirae bacterium]|nr:hypothetical protein [Nitrospirota bacterium]
MKPKARKRDSEEEKEGHIPYFDTENSKGKVKKYGMCPSFSETRVRIRRENINLSAIAGKIADRLKKTHVERGTEFIIAENLIAYCDANLLNVVLENLLGNAWKFTSKNPKALIELGAVECGMRNAECETRNSEFNSALRIPHSEVVYFVRDNGAGFDPDYTEKECGIKIRDPKHPLF